MRYSIQQSQPVCGAMTDVTEEMLRSAMSFQAKFLNPERELRHKFGASVVREDRHQNHNGLPRNVNKRVAAAASRGFLIPDGGM